MHNLSISKAIIYKKLYMTAKNGEEIDWVVEEEDVLACKER